MRPARTVPIDLLEDTAAPPAEPPDPARTPSRWPRWARPLAVGLLTAGLAGGAAHFPTLALVLAFALIGYVVWTADRLSSLAPVAALAARSAPVPVLAGAVAGGGVSLADAGGEGAGSTSRDDGQAPARPGRRAPLSPRLAACCEIAMGVTMGYMLILML